MAVFFSVFSTLTLCDLGDFFLLATGCSPSYLVKFTAIFVPVVYFPILHTLWSRTIGDIVFKLKVVDQQGNNIGFRLALNRFSCVFKYSIFAALFTNLLFMFLMLVSGTVKDIREVSFDFVPYL